MKAKGAASLYEVLKTASRPGGESAPSAAAPAAPPAAEGAAPQATLQDRLAAYKAQKLAEATSAAPVETAPAASVAVAEATPPPAPRAHVPAAPPPPPPPAVTPTVALPAAPPAPAPEPELRAVPAGPGERTTRITFNSLAFAALVVVGLLFVAYAVGVHSGRQRAASDVAQEPAPLPKVVVPTRDPAPPPPPPPPPPPAKVYTLWLAEWRYGTPSERVKADDAVRQLKAALDRANLKGSDTLKVQRGAEPRLAMFIDRVKDPASAETRARLATLQKFRLGTQTPFAQASVVEMPK
jgi:hypothetical protein